MIEKMQKVRIIGPKSKLPAVVDELHQLRILHIVEELSEGLERGEPLPEASKLSEALVQARAAVAQLSLQGNEKRLTKRLKSNRTLSTIIREVAKLTSALQHQLAKKKEAEQLLERAALVREQQALLSSLGLEQKDFEPCESLAIFFGVVKKPGLREALEKSGAKFLLKAASRNREELVALFVDKKDEERAKQVLATHEYAPLELLTESIDERQARRQLQEVERTIRQLAREYKELPDWIPILEAAVEKAEAPLRFGATEQAFLIHGFIPKARYEAVAKRLQERAKGRLSIEPVQFKKGEHVPVELENPEPVKSFQFFLDLYSLPSYKEIDPSWFLFLTFPVFFGFMLGDAGYGLTTLLLFWLLKKKMPQFKGFFNILLFSSFATIVFGFVFGEFFGYELYEPFLSRNPEHSLTPLMVAAVVLGVLHINAGLLTGFVNEYREHGFFAALMEKGSWIVLEAGVALLGLSYTHVISWPPLVGYVVLVVSVLMLYLGEGVKGLVEIPGIFGNILSYIRLMAIGLSSVGLALVINEMAGGFFHEGGLMILVGILILVLGHVINIGIGLLGSFLHSLRLHYVELFGKFYRGGGIRFKPFGSEDR